MSEPTTAAGQALLASAWALGSGEPQMLDTILAIEAEAVATFIRDELPGLLAEAMVAVFAEVGYPVTSEDAVAIAAKIAELRK